MTPEFLLPPEVKNITRLADPTLRRMEKKGLFPKRIHIAPRRIAWRNVEIHMWKDDPEGWSIRSKREGEPCPADLAEDL